jgi:hypothetical protein
MGRGGVGLAIVVLAAGAVASCAAITGIDKYDEVACVNCAAADAASDNAVVTTPDTGTGCAHLFCESFSGASPLAAWSVAATANAMATSDAVVYHDAPPSFLAHIPASMMASAEARLTKTFTSTPLATTAHLVFWINLGTIALTDGGGADASLDETDFIELARIDGPGATAGTSSGVSILLLPSGLAVQIGTAGDGGVTTSVFPASATPTSGKWTQLDLRVVFSGSGAGSIDLSMLPPDQSTATSIVSVAQLTTAIAGATGTTLTLGETSGGTTADFSANYDDLTLDVGN